MANVGLGRILIAALGVLAYKNRDKIADAWRAKDTDPNSPQLQSSNPLDQILNGGGLGDLLDRFRNAGKGTAVDSWVNRGPNEPIDPAHVESAIDAETLDTLVKQTGMSKQEILERLAVNLPDTVDELSPDGTLPDRKTDDGEPTLLDPAPTAPRIG